MINKSDSRWAVVRFCYDNRPNWTPLSPITITYKYSSFIQLLAAKLRIFQLHVNPRPLREKLRRVSPRHCAVLGGTIPYLFYIFGYKIQGFTYTLRILRLQRAHFWLQITGFPRICVSFSKKLCKIIQENGSTLGTFSSKLLHY